MKEEDIIKKLDGAKSAFKTPDGYFDSFTSRLMERMEHEGLLAEKRPTEAVVVEMPERVKAIPMTPVKRWARFAAAAVVASICMIGGTYLYTRSDVAEQTQADSFAELMSEDMLDEALDYELLNNGQIEYYLTEAY